MGGADLKFDSVATCGRSSSFLSWVKFWVATSDHIHSRRCWGVVNTSVDVGGGEVTVYIRDVRC